ncbi:MAG TPA: (deoxy)nucleoside triphosphate pyrophosphohydrolase [Candidatus Anoxymicrobiaceae bacterium]
MSNDSAITVTAAIIVERGQVLIAQRPPGGRHPGEWEFPGGKIEPGETPRQCLSRELDEELAVKVSVGRRLAEVDYSYPDIVIRLIAFECEITGGKITDVECSAHVFIPPDRLIEYEILPPDRVLAREVFGVQL